MIRSILRTVINWAMKPDIAALHDERYEREASNRAMAHQDWLDECEETKVHRERAEKLWSENNVALQRIADTLKEIRNND